MFKYILLILLLIILVIIVLLLLHFDFFCKISIGKEIKYELLKKYKSFFKKNTKPLTGCYDTLQDIIIYTTKPWSSKNKKNGKLTNYIFDKKQNYYYIIEKGYYYYIKNFEDFDIQSDYTDIYYLDILKFPNNIGFNLEKK
jgi:hypothetical protein